MFGIGEGELLLIVLFAFMIFGPDKLPGMGRTLGRALRQFRNAQEGFTEVVQTNIMDPAAEAMSDNPKKPNRKRREEALDEDSDLDAPEGEEAGAPERHVETFAERKKRLAEEKKAREEAEAAAAAAEDADAPAEPAATTDEPSDVKPAEEQKAPKPEAPAHKPTAADLYAMHPTAKTTPHERPAVADAGAPADEKEAE